MEKQHRSDLKISGSASAAGGKFDSVLINGDGDINGDVDCNDLKVNGVSEITGNVKTKSGKIKGMATLNGNLKADASFDVFGMSAISGSVEAKELRIEGNANIGEHVSADRFELKGRVTIKGDCTAETFVSRGAFTINGLLNADAIDIDLYGPCRAKEIGGETIIVRKGGVFKLGKLIKSFLLSLDLETRLSVETIEADDIHLEYTKAKAVCGNNVVIGEGCDIGVVEYKSTFEQSNKSKVRENKKVK